MGYLLKSCLICCALWLSMPAWAKINLTVYAYHTAAPFVINAETETGLNYDAVHALQLALGEQYQLNFQLIARPLLNQRLAAGEPCIVLWASPSWFVSTTKPYLWSSALFVDRDVFVSPSQFKTQINELAELNGSTVGAIRGYRYPGLDELISKGKINRLDAESDKENLSRLLERHVDHIVITRSSFLYYGRQQHFLGKLHITGQPYPAFKREILLTAHYQEFYTQFEIATQALATQAFWQGRLELYGLKTK